MVMDTTTATDSAAGSAPATNRLFELGEPAAGSGPAGPEPAAGRSPRLRYANRAQVEMRLCPLDALIPEEHPVRIAGPDRHHARADPAEDEISVPGDEWAGAEGRQHRAVLMHP